MLAHHVAEFEFGTSALRRAIAECERSFATKELDEYVVALDPLVAVAQVGEEILGLGVGRLVIEERIRRFSFHIRLASEDEYLDRFGGMGRSEWNKDKRCLAEFYGNHFRQRIL